MKVFIVDDSSIILDRLVTLLSEIPGVEVIGQARDASSAIGSIRNLKPDAVILDIRIPGGSGIGVLQEIKRNSPSPQVMIFTNYPTPRYRKRCMAAGADFFFDKSRDMERIAEAFRRLMGRPRT